MIIRNRDEYTVSFAHYLPTGQLWVGKTIKETNLYKLFYGLSLLLLELDIDIQDFKNEFYPVNTTQFLEEWEELLGIPDGCLKNTGTTEERRLNVLGCLGALGAVTEEDWINLADLMGFQITIQRMAEETAWPWTWPHVWGGSAVQNRFITIINFIGVSGTIQGTWPWTWPHVWGEDITKFVQCIFNRIKPAHIKLVFRLQ